METTVETKTIGKYRIDIEPHLDPSDPREDDQFGVMVCFHGSYNLGDKHNYDHRDYDGWEEMKEAIIKNEKPIVILPLYLYDHSGITMNTTGFHCPWDSGQVGFIYTTKKKMELLRGKEKITDELTEQMKEFLIAEVKEYDQYLTGDVYGYCITEVDKEGNDVEQVDSCWGYYGTDYCMEEAESVVNSMIERDKHGQTELDLK